MTRAQRRCVTLLLAVFLCGVAPPVMAQSVDARASWAGRIDFGARALSVAGDAARLQRFRDLRAGPLVQRLSVTRQADTTLRLQVERPGYRDQFARFEVGRPGRFQGLFQFDAVPLFYSRDTASLHRQTSPGRLEVDDSIQDALERRTSTIAAVIGSATAFDLRSQRDTATASLVINASRTADVTFLVRNTDRSGDMPWGGSFGFNNVVELAAPLDSRTTDATVAAEWGSSRGSVRLAYDASFFSNRIETLTWDNPFRLTDMVDGPATGRANLWPSSTAHTVSATSALKLPGRTQGAVLFSLGTWLQDGALLPFTTNTALTQPALDRGSAQAEARVTSMVYSLNSRPSRRLWLTARYRYYDFDNRTAAWRFQPGYVRFDSTIVDFSARPEVQVHRPFAYTRQFLDLDASVSPLPFVAIKAGYGGERDDRTGRYVERTTDQVYRVSLDATGLTWASIRLQYEDGTRTGEGFDEIVLDDVGEQVSLRQFDISDRQRRRTTLLGSLTPSESVLFTLAAGTGRDRRPDARFGLRENDHLFYNVGLDLLGPRSASLGVNYGFERYTTAQQSRQATPFPLPCQNPPQAGCLPEFDDPRRDWTARGRDRVHTANVTLDLKSAAPRTDVRVGYDLSLARTRYTYVVPVSSTLPPVAQLPALLNEWHRAMVDLTHQLRTAVFVGLDYAYERYLVDDFALSPATIDRRDLPGQTVLGYLHRPYRGHSIVVRSSYRW